jgi:hypothetical protein
VASTVTTTRLPEKDAALDLSECRIVGSGGFHVVNVNNTDGTAPLTVRLENTVLNGCRFEGVNWDRSKGRLTLFDEMTAAGTRRKQLVKVAYDRLTALFDESRSYELAEECFVGSMEMLRQDSATSKWHKTWLWLYKRASAYGTSYLYPLLWLFAIWLTSALLFFWVGGLAARNPQPVPALTTSQSEPWREQLIAATVHAAQVALFSAETTYIPQRRVAAILTTLEPIPVAALTALFLLALHRRFHRGH